MSFFHNMAEGSGRNSASFLLILAIGKAIAKKEVQSQLLKDNRSISLITLASEGEKYYISIRIFA